MGEKLIVGVNAFEDADSAPVPTMEIDASTEVQQVQSLQRIKHDRNSEAVQRSLGSVRNAAESGRNVFPALLEAADCRATVQECMDAMADVLGRFRPSAAS
jgi:methylmalonyl-CoA mutase N-terminal domain/subunit